MWLAGAIHASRLAGRLRAGLAYSCRARGNPDQRCSFGGRGLMAATVATVAYLGLEARASLDGARAKVARLIGGSPAGVIFTASATEATNVA